MRTGTGHGNRSMRIVLLLLDLKAEDRLQSQCRTTFWRYCHLRKTATSLSDSRFKFKELGQSSIGKKCSRGHQAFFDLVDDLVDELVANLQFGLGPESLLHSGTVFHRNILNRARFYQRVELKDQDSEGQTSLGEDFDSSALKR